MKPTPVETKATRNDPLFEEGGQSLATLAGGGCGGIVLPALFSSGDGRCEKASFFSTAI